MNLVFMILVLFTSAGPAQITKPFDGTLAECNAKASIYAASVPDTLPGPDGEPAQVLDAQIKCIAFTQGTRASAK